MKKKLLAILFSILISMSLLATPSFAAGEGAPLSNLTGLSEFNNLSNVDILARLIYGEAENQSFTGKVAVAYVVWNRVIIGRTEFGGSNWKSVMLHTDQYGNPDFIGLSRSGARTPNLSSTAWKDSLKIAQNIGAYSNPVGKSLWFVTSGAYSSNTSSGPSGTYYSFPGGGTKLVTYAKLIGDHVFFTVSGYSF